ncbi:MAG: hypothetical protein M3Y82_07135, partial [Verrucomicrobiota bacterium]|nr:hypothetical protein [Verrucomicrobiota bacterium]
SNVGLDDIVLANCAWGAKTVKASSPSTAKKVRLISGRNSLIYSFGAKDVKTVPTAELGKQILSIYNNRVWSVRAKYEHLRTIVLVKSEDLLEVAVFEFETVAYDEKEFTWTWNKNENLQGCNKDGTHCFTWQPHGAQFTIIENVPTDRVAIRIKQPKPLPPNFVLEQVGFDKSWIHVI